MIIYSAGTEELSRWLTWGETQIEYALFMIMFVIIVVLAFKRAWIMLTGTIIALAFLAVFVYDPEMLIKLAEWLAYHLKRG